MADKMEAHAREYAIDIQDDKAVKVEKCGNVYEVTTESGKKYQTKTILFATGTKFRNLNVKGEAEYKNHGVHYCALCDGAFYRNKVIGVVGGADSAAKEALLLTEYGSKVYMIVRGEKIRPEPVNEKRVASNKKIEVISKTNVVEIAGDGKNMTHIVLDRPYNGSNKLELGALFIEIGHIPLSDLARNIGVSLNNHGEIIITRYGETNVPGIFAAGDVADAKFKQAITGVGEGVSAVYSAYQHINENGEIYTCDDKSMTEESKEGKK
ncbi:FAD-dependent oxidoreductase [Candidatus Micrarchaeota archaeon]|nr:FAD-dependent oxidoreductase [Candidatus Micrarchaeota archaeon]